MPYSATYACDIPTLIAKSAALQAPNMDEKQQNAIEIYAKIQNLAALGGTDYSADLNGLLTAAAAYNVLRCTQRKAISTYIAVMNAINDGATLAGAAGGATDAITDPSALMAAATCYKCIGTEDQKNLIEYLKCVLNANISPD